MEPILLGTIDRSILVFIPDPAQTDGSGNINIAHTDLTVSYTRVETDNDVIVTDVTSSLNALTNLTDAHNDWGWKQVDSATAPGLYRLDVADALFAAGAWYAVVYVMLTSSAASPAPKAFRLVAVNELDAVRFGLSALPNAAAGASAGVPVIGTGSNNFKSDSSANVTVAGYATGQAPLQPTVAGRTLDVSATGEAGLDWANIGSPTTSQTLSGTTVNTTTNLTNAPPDSAGVTTLLSRIPAALFSGITSLAQWLGLLGGKQVGNSTARTEMRATGAGSGTFDETTDSQEALRDRGDAAWTTGSGTSTLTQADVRAAVGLASANLDTQLDALPTNADLATALGTADDATLAAIAGLNNLSAAQVNAEVDTALADVGVTSTVTGRIDVAVSSRSSHTAADVWAVGTRTLTSFGTLIADLLATAVTQSNVSSDTTLTVMKALLAAWVQAAGSWSLVGTTLTLKNPDGTTFRTFTLDSATDPTSRI